MQWLQSNKQLEQAIACGARCSTATLGCNHSLGADSLSKKYKGKTCVYCVDAPSTGADHVIAREFFTERWRQNLPKVPACSGCNSRKARLETLLTALIPMASDHPVALEISSTALPRRLAKNEALQRSLISGMQPVWREMPNGLLLPSVMFPGYGTEFSDLFDLIVRGLIWYEWRAFVPKDHDVRVATVLEEGVPDLRRILLSCGTDHTIRRVFAGGGFVYTATRNSEDAAMSMWELAFYSGTQMATPRDQRIVPLFVFVITGPHAIIEKADAAT